MLKYLIMDNAAASYWIYKEEVKKWIYEHFNENANILDVGPGRGTYWELLHGKYKNIDAVEIYRPNIIDYKLLDKYRFVANRNIVDMEYGKYDLAIFGDVLEHLTVEDAQKVLAYAVNKCKEVIVAVPYRYKQQGNENKYEEHIQNDLTHEIVLQRYPILKVLYKNDSYGYYIKR